MIDAANQSETRRCRGPCNLDLPLDEFHFGFEKKNDPPFTWRCRKCTNARIERNKKARKDGLKRHVAKTNKENAKIKKLTATLEASLGAPHPAELTEKLFDRWGGLDSFVDQIWNEYNMIPPGKQARMKVLETIIRLTVQNADMGGAKKPMELMTTEEVIAERDRMIAIAALNMQPRIDNQEVIEGEICG
jgi:hypothetical protein